MILLGAFLDFWDGFLARKLGVAGDLGKELDSLADMVTFGVLPAFLLFSIMKSGGIYIETLKPYSETLPFLAFLIAPASAFRLARFNLDTRQSDKFIGLPTPANALLIGAIALSFQNRGVYFPIFWFNEVNSILILLLCYFLNAPIELIALKFKNFTIRDNLMRFLLIASALVLLIFLNFAAIPVIILMYLVLSIIQYSILR
jgi:CDP-diacylglycerol--serine O-phosphatidyltransferase